MVKKILIPVIFLIFSITINSSFGLSLEDISRGSSNIFSKLFESFSDFFSTPNQISCENCEVGSCSCSVNICQSGFVDIHETEECKLTPSYSKTFSGGSFVWNPESEGTYGFKVLCDDGTKGSCIQINVGQNGEEELDISSVYCDRYECTLDITSNPLTEGLVIFFELVDDTGTIYYSSNLNLEPGVLGEKKLIISRNRRCPSETELELFVFVYKLSNFDHRIYRISEESFIC